MAPKVPLKHPWHGLLDANRTQDFGVHAMIPVNVVA